MMFRFYGLAFYFLINDILVILIVIICFIFFGKYGREPHQQKKVIKVEFNGEDHKRKVLTAGINHNEIIEKRRNYAPE
jgi:uncharacterized membrane protein YvbJ